MSEDIIICNVFKDSVNMYIDEYKQKMKESKDYDKSKEIEEILCDLITILVEYRNKIAKLTERYAKKLKQYLVTIGIRKLEKEMVELK